MRDEVIISLRISSTFCCEAPRRLLNPSLAGSTRLHALERALVRDAGDLTLLLVYDRPEREKERRGLSRTTPLAILRPLLGTSEARIARRSIRSSSQPRASRRARHELGGEPLRGRLRRTGVWPPQPRTCFSASSPTDAILRFMSHEQKDGWSPADNPYATRNSWWVLQTLLLFASKASGAVDHRQQIYARQIFGQLRLLRLCARVQADELESRSD